MKKLTIIIGFLIFSCTPEDDAPLPAPTLTPEPIVVVQNPYNFEGVYKCDNWTLSAFGHVGIAQIEMYGQEETFVRFNLIRNSIQQFSGEYAVIDSNYFDVGHAGVNIRYRGNLIHEDTLRVTEYAYDDVGQTKDFIRQ